jgi:hypothetical protein
MMADGRMTGEASLEGPADGELRCPTCGARQEWSDTCRRCKCDLVLLRRVAGAGRACRRQCLRSLRAGRIGEALHHARRLYALFPDRPAARLLAVCHLLRGNWAAALVLSRRG